MNDAQLLACMASAWNGEPTYCRWCNKPLAGRRQRWCSDECADEFGRNHWWGAASHAARRRDNNTCVMCGVKPDVDPETDRYNGVVLQVHHRVELHTLRHSESRGYSWRKGERIKHGDSGCHHHLDGLVTLCAQRRDGIQPCHHRVHHGEKPPPPEQLRIEAA